MYVPLALRYMNCVTCVALFPEFSVLLYVDLFRCKFLCKGSTLAALDFLQFALWKIYIKRLGGHNCAYRDIQETLWRHLRSLEAISSAMPSSPATHSSCLTMVLPGATFQVGLPSCFTNPSKGHWWDAAGVRDNTT